MRLYRDFATQEELDRAYNPSLGEPKGLPLMQGWPARSAEARQRLDGKLGLRYGPTLAEHMNLYPAGPDAPVHLFIHGGYWRALAADDFDFIAPPLVEAGITTGIVNYALCPLVTIEEIVRQIRAAIAWTFGHIAEHGGNPGRITISGHSAGGHLVGMAAATDWPGDYGLPADIVKGGIAISGLMDLAPFPYTYLQPKLQLTWEQVRRCSPIQHARSGGPELILAAGGAESQEFHRQSQSFDRLWRSCGNQSELMILDGHDHFTVLEELIRPGAALADAAIKLIRGR